MTEFHKNLDIWEVGNNVNTTTNTNSNISFPMNGRNNNFGAYNVNSSSNNMGGGGGGGSFNTVANNNRRTSIQGTFDPFQGLGQKI